MSRKSDTQIQTSIIQYFKYKIIYQFFHRLLEVKTV